MILYDTIPLLQKKYTLYTMDTIVHALISQSLMTMCDVLRKNKIGQIITDPKKQRTSVENIWSAGDCSDGLYHQNNIAAGDAVKALEDIYLALR